MSLPCRPWFNWGYDLENDLELDLPMFPWTRGRSGVGGSDTAASGIPEAYVIRRDRLVFLRLRVRESEMDLFDEFLDWAQDSGEPFNFRFDTTISDSLHSVYLHSLRWEDGPEFQHERAEYQPMFVVDMALRTELGGAFDYTWTELAVQEEGSES